ncbi:hypothetical protein SAMN05444392_12033 [Seinonella peptonophila]|uniref:Uncharacterized protein n=1 Tax=Seinonella peptonophila TaxID=112248 RepID=A0A1M5BB74_9BACL|nr:hypothetical protein [Seinonella peptonophila]SHF39636.1 hypothetical protein SAMN05444392_12033 [Seinonella peptonophila]
MDKKYRWGQFFLGVFISILLIIISLMISFSDYTSAYIFIAVPIIYIMIGLTPFIRGSAERTHGYWMLGALWVCLYSLCATIVISNQM